jgi:predicted small lipoprotein YifL
MRFGWSLIVVAAALAGCGSPGPEEAPANDAADIGSEPLDANQAEVFADNMFEEYYAPEAHADMPASSPPARVNPGEWQEPQVVKDKAKEKPRPK